MRDEQCWSHPCQNPAGYSTLLGGKKGGFDLPETEEGINTDIPHSGRI